MVTALPVSNGYWRWKGLGWVSDGIRLNGGAASAGALPVLLALGCVWGASFLFIKVIVDEISPIELVAGRLFFGAVSIGLFMLARRVAAATQSCVNRSNVCDGFGQQHCTVCPHCLG